MHSFESSLLSFSVSVYVPHDLGLARVHLSLVVRVVAGQNWVLFGRHRHADLLLVNQRASHRLLGLLSRRRSIDHLLWLKQELVHSRTVNWASSTDAMDIVGCHWHLLGIYELAHDVFVCHALAARAIRRWYGEHWLISILRTLRILTYLSVLLRNAALCDHVRADSLRISLSSPWLALGSPKRLSRVVSCSECCLAAAELFLLLNVVIVSGVAIEVLSMRSTARLILAFILNVARQTLSLNLYVLLWNTTVSELCVSLFWINVSRNRLRRLLA